MPETSSTRILIVDDNDDNRYTLQLLLEGEGYTQLDAASGGREAVGFLAKNKYSLVLLDMMMPDISGEEVLKVMKDNPDLRDIPVVVLSSDSNIDRVSHCIEMGADDYLPKPFNSTLLRARVSAAIRKASLAALQQEYVNKIEQERVHTQALLRNILPFEIALRLRNGESNIADNFAAATIVFADVVGFGKITARMRAFEIVACLNRLFSEFDRLAESLGVEKIKTVGDSYMAACGLPLPREDHARAAVELALGMVTAARRLQTGLPAEFPIRVGVHSGPVVAGVIGTKRFAYDVWGDTVNVAARMEAASEPHRVLVSATTAEMLGGRFRLDGPHNVQTKEQRTLQAFFVSAMP